MQISLRQAEIEKAVINYVADQGITMTNKEAKIVFTAGRGEQGLSASIDIEPMGTAFIAEVQKSVNQETPMMEAEFVSTQAAKVDDVEDEAKPTKVGKTVGGLFS